MKCINCLNLKDEWCEQVNDSPCEDIERDCRYFKQKSNADHIRSMSDEELNGFLLSLDFCPSIACDKCEEANCHNCVFKWLKQPHKEKEDG